MTQYSVKWEIDAEADTPRDAAIEAWESMRAPGSIANVFTVVDCETGSTTTVDLLEDGIS